MGSKELGLAVFRQSSFITTMMTDYGNGINFGSELALSDVLTIGVLKLK